MEHTFSVWRGPGGFVGVWMGNVHVTGCDGEMAYSSITYNSYSKVQYIHSQRAGCSIAGTNGHARLTTSSIKNPTSTPPTLTITCHCKIRSHSPFGKATVWRASPASTLNSFVFTCSPLSVHPRTSPRASPSTTGVILNSNRSYTAHTPGGPRRLPILPFPACPSKPISAVPLPHPLRARSPSRKYTPQLTVFHLCEFSNRIGRVTSSPIELSKRSRHAYPLPAETRSCSVGCPEKGE